jgi:hypothetical protein
MNLSTRLGWASSTLRLSDTQKKLLAAVRQPQKDGRTYFSLNRSNDPSLANLNSSTRIIVATPKEWLDPARSRPLSDRLDSQMNLSRDGIKTEDEFFRDMIH